MKAHEILTKAAETITQRGTEDGSGPTDTLIGWIGYAVLPVE